MRRGGGAKLGWSVIVERGFWAGIVFRVDVADIFDIVGEGVKEGEAVR